MQLQSTLSHLTAFTLFMLSFSMLACAAPAPAAVPAPGALVVRGLDVSTNLLVTRADVSNQCYQALANLSAEIDLDIDSINTCHDTENCDCKPIVAKIVADIQATIDIILNLAGTIDAELTDIVELVVNIVVKLATACGTWVIKLGLSAYLDIFVAIDEIFVTLLTALIKLSTTISVEIKVSLVVHVAVLLGAHLDEVIKLIGL